MRIYQRDRGQRVCVKPAKANVALAPLSKAEVTGKPYSSNQRGQKHPV